MVNLISQSFQHQIIWKIIFLVASTYHYWDPKCGRLENFGFWKKQSAINLVSFCFWQMYVVIHFWTYLHFEWLINSTFFIRTIVRLVFEFWNFPSNFVTPRVRCPQSASKRKKQSLLVASLHGLQHAAKTPTNMNVSFKWRKWMWYIWYGHYFPLHHTLYSACDEGRNGPLETFYHSKKVPKLAPGN